MCCVRFLQRVLTCSEKDISSSISRPSSVTFITLVGKLPLQVISELLFILVQSRFPFTNCTFGLFLIEWKPIGQCPVKNVWYRCIKRFLQSYHAVTVCWRCDYSVACIKIDFRRTDMRRQVLPCEYGLTLRCSVVFYAQPYGKRPLLSPKKRFEETVPSELSLIERFSNDLKMKTRGQNRRNKRTEIQRFHLVYRTDTNAHGFWLVKRTIGWKNFKPENFLEINRYYAFTSY